MKFLFAFFGIIATLGTQYISKHYIDIDKNERVDCTDKKVNSKIELKRDMVDSQPDTVGH